MAIRAFSSSSFLRHYRDDVEDLAAWRLFDGIDPAAEAVSRMLEPAKIDPVGGVPLPIRLVARPVGSFQGRLESNPISNDDEPHDEPRLERDLRSTEAACFQRRDV